MKHITERKHTAVNKLFKYSCIMSNNVDKKFKKVINNFQKMKLNVVKITFI